MKLGKCVHSLLLFALLLVGCANQQKVIHTLVIPTETSIPTFTRMPPATPTNQVSPAITPSSSSTPEQNLTLLSSLSLPEFNARYSAREIALIPDRQIMAVIAKDRFSGEESAWLWDVNDFEHSLAAYQNMVDDLQSIAFSSDGNKLGMGGKGKIVILDWKTGDLLESIVFPNSGLLAVQISFGPNSTLLSSHQNGQLTVWDLVPKGVKYSIEITANPGLFSSFTVSPNGTTLIAGMEEETNLWDFKTGQRKDVVKNPGDTHLTSFFYSVDGKWIATGGCTKFGFEACAGGQLVIWKSSFENPSITISNIHEMLVYSNLAQQGTCLPC